MNTDAAIKLVKEVTGMSLPWDDNHYEALQLAIQALYDSKNSMNKWIPVSERLPEDDTEVIVSCTDDSGDSEFSYTTTGWHYKGMWVVNNDRSFFVIAWMPLPSPYKVN